MKKTLIYLGEEKEFFIEDINPFCATASEVAYVREVYVVDPFYGKRHRASVYRILKSGTEYAVAEFSNNVCGIYLFA